MDCERNTVHISEGESVIMEVLWLTSPLAAEEIVAAAPAQDGQKTTVKTLINRLPM
ncbi:MAG: BlaI/MecI/CopY family transcriptional regulator [Dokdonella sp.]